MDERHRPPSSSLWAILTDRIGTYLTLATAICIVWLGVTGRLSTYIHPRYALFAIAMGGIAIVMATASLGIAAKAGHHEHVADVPTRPRRQWIAKVSQIVGLGICFVVVGSFLTLPPTALSASLAEGRSDESIAYTASSPAQSPTEEGDTSHLRLRDWQSLLNRGTDVDSVEGLTFTGIGFVAASTTSTDHLYLTRFVVACCAVDAQPVSVEVYAPGWRQQIMEGDWVSVEGIIGKAQEAAGMVVIDSDVQRIDQPVEPYEY